MSSNTPACSEALFQLDFILLDLILLDQIHQHSAVSPNTPGPLLRSNCYLISYNSISCYLLSCYLIPFYLIFYYLISFFLIPFYLISSYLIPCYFIFFNSFSSACFRFSCSLPTYPLHCAPILMLSESSKNCLQSNYQ